MKNLMSVCCAICICMHIQAQDKLPVKFGKVDPQDFTITSDLIDANTNAVVVADVGKAEFLGNNKGWFSILFKRTCRIKIINNKGFDAAKVIIPLYSNGENVEKIDNLKATTYNLENGSVVATKLESKEVFEEKVSKRFTRVKFTHPAVKEGSIIEFSYTVKTDFILHLQAWEFQGKYPTLWSEYEVAFPDFFIYTILAQGYLKLITPPDDVRSGHFTVNVPNRTAYGRDDLYSINGSIIYRKWIAKDAPALQEEAFTSTIDNHIAKIEFQLSEYRFPNQPSQTVMSSWPVISERMLKREDFGAVYTKANNWLNEDMKQITKGAATPEEKAKKIYAFVRDNFKCTSEYGIYQSDLVSTKDIFNKKSGSVSDINLLLIAMLRHESLSAEPVLMSLRDRGVVHPVYPLMDRFNYLICELKLDDNKYIYLDATKPMLGFGKLLPSCYNGTAWVLNQQPVDVSITADAFKETTNVSLFVSNDDSGNLVSFITAELGDHESYKFRRFHSAASKQDIVKRLSSGMGELGEVVDYTLDSLALYDQNVIQTTDFKRKNFEEDIVYISPMMGEAEKENPFKSANRYYPVEMPYTIDRSYSLTMEIPKGYKVDELPKSTRVMLNGDEGMFEYLISANNSQILLKSKILIKKAKFGQDDYETLRNFFGFIVKKHAEQIVLKKAN